MYSERTSDSELINQFRNGNHKCYEILIKKYEAKVFWHIKSMIKDQSIAEDIYQDACIKVVKCLRASNYNEEGKFYSWFKRIANNLTIDFLRRNTKLKHQSHVVMYEKEMDIFDSLQNNEPTALEDMVEAQVHKELREVIEMLSEEQKEIIMLRHFKQWSFKDIAEVKGISINTALGRMRYALKNIRKILEEKEVDLSI